MVKSKAQYLCKQCGFIDKRKEFERSAIYPDIFGIVIGIALLAFLGGNILVYLFALALIIICAINASGKALKRELKCPQCASNEIIPESSPRAKEILDKLKQK